MYNKNVGFWNFICTVTWSKSDTAVMKNTVNYLLLNSFSKSNRLEKQI